MGTRQRPSISNLSSKVRSSKSSTSSTVIDKRSSLLNNTPAQSRESVLNKFEVRLKTLEEENCRFKELIEELRTELSEHKKEISLLKSQALSTESGISVAQEEINRNIVIRGLEITSESTPESVSTAFVGLCSHLGISSLEFEPESIEVVKAEPNNSTTSFRPLKVRFQTITAKRNFLQIRRVKKDIYPKDLGLTQKNNQPLRINEQLTRSNQELLFQARSLRGSGNFKFVWSCNGQILVRKEHRSRVIRVRDLQHLETLRGERSVLNNPDHGFSRPRIHLRNGPHSQDE